MIDILYYGKVIDGKLVIDGKEDLQDDISKLTGDVSIEIKPLKKHRSPRQNNYYHGVVIKTMAESIGYTPDEMHKAIKLHFGIQTTKYLTQDEFQDYLDRIIRWAAQNFGIHIPDPTRSHES